MTTRNDGSSSEIERIVGSISNDTLVGESGDDSIYGGEWNDRLFGLSGNDTLDGGSGNDVLNGGNGFDRLIGGSGSDTFQLQFDVGQIRAGVQDTIVDFDTSVDTLQLNSFNSQSEVDGRVVLTSESLSVNGFELARFETPLEIGSTLNLLSNGQEFGVVVRPPSLFSNGNDNVNFETVAAGSFLEGTQFDAGAGDDFVRHINFSRNDLGFSSADLGFREDIAIQGGAGNDTILAGHGNDLVEGGTGNDVLNGGVGNDVLIGGDGNDVVNGFAGTDRLTGGAGADRFELQLNNGGPADTIVDFNVFEDVLDLGTAREFFLRDAAETLTLTETQLTYTSASGFEAVLANFENPLVGGETVTAVANGQYFGLRVIPTIEGGEGNDFLSGSEDIDTFEGLGGDDVIVAGGAADQLNGGSGNDFLLGEGGDDILNGGQGNDTLEAGIGNNVLSGGEGADHFTFVGRGSSDRIVDFSEDDSIELLGVSSFDQVGVSTNGVSTFLEFGAGSVIELEGTTLERAQFNVTQVAPTTILLEQAPPVVEQPSGDTVICTHMNKMGYIPDDVYRWDSHYGRNVLGETVLAGYHFWAVPLVEHVLAKSPLATRLLAPAAQAWAKEMAHRCDPKNHQEGSALGKIFLALGVPVCFAIGLLVHALHGSQKKVQ